MNIYDWLLSQGESGFQASAIFAGLEMNGMTLDEQKAAYILYRRWRPDKKSAIKSFQAFQLTINGLDPDDYPDRQMDLFEAVTPLAPACKGTANE